MIKIVSIVTLTTFLISPMGASLAFAAKTSQAHRDQVISRTLSVDKAIKRKNAGLKLSLKTTHEDKKGLALGVKRAVAPKKNVKRMIKKFKVLKIKVVKGTKGLLRIKKRLQLKVKTPALERKTNNLGLRIKTFRKEFRAYRKQMRVFIQATMAQWKKEKTEAKTPAPTPSPEPTPDPTPEPTSDTSPYEYYEDGAIKSFALHEPDGDGAIKYHYGTDGENVIAKNFSDGSYKEYDSRGNVTLDQMLNGLSVTYNYDVNRVLESSTEVQDGVTTKVSVYSTDGKLVALVIYENGIAHHGSEYDSNGNVISEDVYDAEGMVVKTVQYDASGNIALTTLFENNIIKTQILNQADSDGATEYHYDASGRFVIAKSMNDGSYREFDKLGRVTSETSPSGIKIDYAFSTTGELSSVTKSQDNQLIEVAYYSDSGTLESVGVYESGNLYESIQYDPSDGSVQSRTLYDEVGNVSQITTFNATGLKTGVTKHNSGIVTYSETYDANGSLHESTEYVDGMPKSMTVYHENGSIQSVTDYSDDQSYVQRIYFENGEVTRELFYDASQVLTHVINYDGSGNVEGRVEYEASGNQISSTLYYVSGVVSSQDNYVDGVILNKTLYFESGSMKEQQVFAGGVRVTYTGYNEDGSVRFHNEY